VFFLAEYANMILVSFLTAIMFLGGWLSPVQGWMDGPLAAPGPWWLAAKVVFFMFTLVWLRATFPRYRYDQIMRLGWKVFIPITIAWVMVAAWMVWDQWIVIGA
jgi:NADH-quinone oxidoreductase subunit H